MIFSNDGHTQIGGDPTENMREITWIIRTLRQRYADVEGDDFVDKMLVFAGRLSTLNENQEDGFFRSISGRSLDINELLQCLDDYISASERRKGEKRW